ncbi:hypothetical protein G159_06255 [Planococcus glaciei CHR43]|nr:hypothetical protein G159_06255 [Planococcus glaciei CHR43]
MLRTANKSGATQINSEQRRKTPSNAEKLQAAQI